MSPANSYVFFVADMLPNEKTIKFGSPEVMQSVNNIYKMSDKGGKPVQVTHHGDGNLYFPSISADGKTIVYEDNFGIWKLDVASGKSNEIRVDIKSDGKENDTELVTLANDAEGFHLSPSNRRAAIVAHGEIFTIATDRGETQRVTETPWKEQDPRWAPNGKWIAFVSDRTGREEVFLSDELGKTVKQISDMDCDKSNIVYTMFDLSQSMSLICFTVLPSSSDRKTSSRPVRSETNAIHLPFGAQRGSCSFHGVSVTRCVSPRSVAMVKISPCATMAARRFEG